MAALLLSLVACFSIVGCKREQEEVISPAAALALKNLPPPKLVESEESAGRRKITEEAVALLAKGDFKTLDDRARELRQSKSSYPTWPWELRSFYHGIENIPEEAPDRQWAERIDFCKKWSKERPKSITPRVALAEVLVNYAWKARGTGYADTVTKEGEKLMEQRLALARQVLVEARSLDEKCPQWWLVAQDVALGEGWDVANYNKMCDEGLRLFPRNHAIYFGKAYFLQPRWYGKPGEWEQFAAASADKLGGEDGEILFARIIWSLHSLGLFRNMFSESTVKWERVKHCFQTMDRRFPNSLSLMSQFAGLACNAADWKTARELFQRIGGRVEKDQWSEAQFTTFRRHAFIHVE